MRLDLEFALSILLRYCSNLDSTHIYAITCVLRYVKEILYYNIYYEENKSLIDYIDANFAKAINNCCSTSK